MSEINQIETGGYSNYDFGARIYDPRIARFLSVDPYARLRTWVNPYNFVQNSPMIRIDPTGALDDDIYHDSKTGNNVVVQTDDKFDRYFVDGKFDSYLSQGQGKFWADNGCEETFYFSYDKAPWLRTAFKEMGTGEWSKGNNPGVMKYWANAQIGGDDNTANAKNDETSWCSAFTDYCIISNGFAGNCTGGWSGSAWSYKNSESNTTKLSGPKYGAIVLANTSHVGFVLAENSNYIIMVGGNQGKPGSVNITRWPKEGTKFKYFVPNDYKGKLGGLNYTTFPSLGRISNHSNTR